MQRRVAWMLDALLIVVVIGLLAVPFLSERAASGLPRRASFGAPLPPRAGTASARQDLTLVPAFSPGSTLAAPARGTDVRALRRALRATAVAAFGTSGARRFVALLDDPESVDEFPSVPDTDQVDIARVPYPFHFAHIDRILDRVAPRRPTAGQARRMNDLAAAIELADTFPYSTTAPKPIAAYDPNRIAFSLLLRARPAGGCLPQLNLLALEARDVLPRDDVVAAEGARAARTCPGDPTPLWLLGEYQLQRGAWFSSQDGGGYSPGQRLPRADRVARPFATFARLRRAMPGSPVAWAGEADARLSLAYQLKTTRPFTARGLAERALAGYETAARLARADAPYIAGAARALGVLGRRDEAVAMQARAARLDHGAAQQLLLIDDLLEAGRFERAATVAARLAHSGARTTPGTMILPNQLSDDTGHQPDLDDEAALGPLSLWAGARLHDITVGADSGQGAASLVSDLGFIPRFHAFQGVTEPARGCPDLSRRVALLLAGRPRPAATGWPATFRSADQFDCEAPLLHEIALREAGQVRAAVAAVRVDVKEFTRYGGQQDPNIHRYAGEPTRSSDCYSMRNRTSSGASGNWTARRSRRDAGRRSRPTARAPGCSVAKSPICAATPMLRSATSRSERPTPATTTPRTRSAYRRCSIAGPRCNAEAARRKRCGCSRAQGRMRSRWSSAPRARRAARRRR